MRWVFDTWLLGQFVNQLALHSCDCLLLWLLGVVVKQWGVCYHGYCEAMGMFTAVSVFLCV